MEIIKRQYKKLQNRVFDKYDEPYEVATLVGKCIFCRIVTSKYEVLEYEVISWLNNALIG